MGGEGCGFSPGGTQRLVVSLFVMLGTIDAHCLSPLIHWGLQNRDILILPILHFYALLQYLNIMLLHFHVTSLSKSLMII